MPTPTLIAGTAGALAFLGLVVLALQPRRSPWLRAGLALVASLALVVVLSGQPTALVLFGVNVLLVLGTWQLARTRLWLPWVVVLIAVLAAARLPATQRLLGMGGSPFDLSPGLWLGISYLIFRLVHATLDMHAGRINRLPLAEFITYALHPASLVAGPIDRFQNSLAAQEEQVEAEGIHQGAWRVLLGVFVKVVIANPLYAFIAGHNMAANPDQPVGVAWLWLLAYSFYLWADFAAYSHIAIGFGRLAGLRLPENFNWPYLAPSLTVFWQRWHITLSTWARDYIFFPLARGLRTRLDPSRRDLIQFAAHMATMLGIGLWHGLTPAFAVWGVWHGLGMFITGQVAARRPRRRPGKDRLEDRIRAAFGIAGTFAFVTLGWVFFAADLPTAVRILGRLFGVL